MFIPIAASQNSKASEIIKSENRQIRIYCLQDLYNVKPFLPSSKKNPLHFYTEFTHYLVSLSIVAVNHQSDLVWSSVQLIISITKIMFTFYVIEHCRIGIVCWRVTLCHTPAGPSEPGSCHTPAGPLPVRCWSAAGPSEPGSCSNFHY